MEDVRKEPKDRLCQPLPCFYYSEALRGTCKKPGCKGKICMRCIKCEVHLCLNKIEIVFLNSIRTGFFYVDFSNYILRCTIFFLNALENCTKCIILFSNVQKRNKNYIALFLYGHWPRGPFSPAMITVPCPQENHMVLFSGFIQYIVFLTKFEIYVFFSSQ